MNKIKIDIPKGHKASFDEAKGEITFVELPKDIKERIKNFDNVLLELQIIPKDFAQQCEGLSKDEVAYRKIKLIVRAFNEGWTPDWSNSNEYKYVPYFKMGSPSGGGFSCHVYAAWDSDSAVGSRLCFETGEKAKYAGKQFEDLYKAYFVKA